MPITLSNVLFLWFPFTWAYKYRVHGVKIHCLRIILMELRFTVLSLSYLGKVFSDMVEEIEAAFRGEFSFRGGALGFVESFTESN